MSDFDRINDATGFANGEMFATPAEVLEYFTVDNQVYMFEQQAVTDQDQLDVWADIVIATRWHMKPQNDVR